MFSVAFIYAANFSIAKIVMGGGYVPPSTFILCRITSALVLFTVYHYLFVKEKIQPDDKKPMIWLAFFGVAANQLLFFMGLALTTPIHAALIMTITPISVVIVESVLRESPLTFNKVFGVLIAFTGAIFIILSGSDISFDGQTMLGDFFVFANAVFYSIYLVKVKPLVRKYHPITINRVTFLYGFFMVLPFGFPNITGIQWGAFDTRIWLSFLYVLIFTTFFAYYLNSWAMLIVKPSVVGVYIYLQPLLTIIIAIIIGTDKPDINIILAGLLIFTGVFLTSYTKNIKKDT
ncbi:DMT family transporter [Saprospiraceae bacterium]